MILALILLAAPSNLPALPGDVPKTAQMYDVQMLGKPAGQFAVWHAPDGKLHSFFQYNDRGRGPKMYTAVAADSSSVPLSIQIEGNDYMKDPSRETFTLEGGTARWKNKGEDGSARVAGPAFYTAMAESPFEAALLVQALRAHGGRLALLPGGEARLTKVVSRPKASLYAVTGLDFSPSYVWIGNDGELFAQVGGWLTIVKQGEEGRAEELKEAQKQARMTLDVDRVRRLAHKPKGKLLFHDAAIFDSETARLQPHHDVLIEGNRIVAVTPTGPAPAGVEVIEAAGKTLLPGLIDMHAHVSDDQGILNLAAGVTSVRDLANDNDELYARIQRIQNGQELGTRIFRAGFMDGPGPFQGPTKVLVATPQEALHWVDWYADHGFIQVKLYSSLKPELVPIIAEEAHRRGLRVSGHIPSGMFADQCIKEGYDEIQHVNFLMLNFLRDVKETNGRQRFTAVAERGANIDVRSPEVQQFVELLRDRHTTLDPTLSVFENMLLARPGVVPPGLVPLFDRLPVQIRRGALAGDLPVPEGMDARYRESFQRMLQLVHEMWQAGVPIEAGTDGFAGFALERELELDVAAGIPAPQALQLATFGAAHILGQDTQLGAIRQARLADLILVDGDPSQRISDIRKVVLTVKDGVVYEPPELDQELGVRPL